MTCSSCLCFLEVSFQNALPPLTSLFVLPASATMPAVSGAAALVPHTSIQPPYVPMYSATPGLQPASAETSEIVLPLQSGSCCHGGFGVVVAQPAPAPSQTISL